ncbi:MAG: ABC transporter ATP-binding protein [Nitrospiraceae bacterium]|nr:ABC transporter ATP-binding protein [Nitrospiraceae bacterium]
MDIVAAHNLVKEYGIITAVNNVSFSISPGECFGFLGPNGAGKTTVMRIISCFLPPTSGTVTVFGVDVTREPSAIKSRLGVMPQEDNLDPDLSVLENLIVYARYFDIPKKTSIPLANDLLAFAELQDRGKMNIKELSGGMKRRLMLARSLVNTPELLILDEPTTGLDPHSRRAVWDKLNQLKFRNTTLLLTTHYMEEAEQLCDRVAIMDAGRVVTIDTPQNLMTEHGGNLENVYLKLTGRNLAD